MTRPALHLGPTAVAGLLGTLMGFSGMGSAAAAVAVPDIVQHFDVPVDRGVWVLAAYTLTVAVGTALYGRLGDSRGVRGPLAFGVVLLSTGGVLAALAPTYGVLVLARLLQGAGAAAAPTLTMVALRVLYPPAIRVRVISVLVGTAVGVTALGPVLGGVATTTLGWQSTMLFPAAGLVGVVALWSRLPASGSGERLDVLGAVLVASAAAGLVLIVQSPALGREGLLGGLALFLPGSVLLWWWIRVTPKGFLPREVLAQPTVLWAACGASGVTISFFGLLVVVPALLAARGWSAAEIGLAMLPGAVVGVAVSLTVSRMVARFGARVCVLVAGAMGTLGLLTSLLALHTTPMVHLASMALVSSGFSIGQPALSTVVGDAVPDSLQGISLGVATLLFFGGGSLGAAVAGLGPTLGWTAGLLLLAALPATAVVLSALGLSDAPPWRRTPVP